MLAKRIIPCLDVKDGRVVKGVRFRGHRDAGDIVTLARAYNEAGADELVFYDITASSEGRVVDTHWIEQIARWLNIPFCVAGGVRSAADARQVLNAGADKVSINTPALRRPDLITELAQEFGKQCVVVGIDSMATQQGYMVYQYTGDPSQSHAAGFYTVQWLREVQRRGAGEIVLNCMNQDGVKQGYDIAQLQEVRASTHVPLIASGGAGTLQHFSEAFKTAGVDGALAASVFHDNILTIQQVKAYLADQRIEVRL